MVELHKVLQQGPDGFPAEFYKEFWPMLAPIFHRMVSEIKETLINNMKKIKTHHSHLAVVQYHL